MERSDADLVEKARGGDRAALEALAQRYLPLVYTVVGRAADADLDVDDIVQETMVRLVAGLPSVREAERFRAWVVTIALRQVTDARGAARARRLLAAEPGELAERPDPGSDFVGLSMLREALTNEQREVAAATRWLDEGYRQLLSLWWLEVGGHLTRAEVAAALGEPPGHVAVRVQRMKEQLDTARAVVRAVHARARCAELDAVLEGWNGEPDPLWRKRIARHLRDCDTCGGTRGRLIPPERLLAGLPLLVPPKSLLKSKALLLKVLAGAAVAIVGAVAFVALPHQSPAPPPAASSENNAVVAEAPAVQQGLGSVSPTPAKSAPAQPFTDKVPALPRVVSAKDVGAVRQHSRIAGRDNGQSTKYNERSVWVFDDTTLQNPWGFLSSTSAATKDLDASDGIDLSADAPADLIPHTQAERDFEKQHDKSGGCTAQSDPFCGSSFAYWPGPVIADPARGRVLVFYGKLCRGGGEGTPCSGPLGKGLGTGVAAVDMNKGTVTRLTAANGPAVTSVEGVDRTMFFPDGQGWSSAALVVDNAVYAYGACTYQGCHLAKVALTDIADRARWTFWTAKGTWSPDPGAAANTIAAGAAGETVFYVPALKAWMNVLLAYGSTTAQFQVGGSPSGPWSKPQTLGQTMAGAYAMFGHVEYAQRDGLVQYLTYFHPESGAQRLYRVEFATG
ncbi:sigma-70 family RNA polymerase sigma factor [Dactylosporangium sp. CS-033363]|uniref:sigma-70 family RNA polymerase sigma factor n=1 Tax=Dactylosporangium sp. CS-033363 TaxID=3239935 RepID=UPI003D8CB31D